MIEINNLSKKIDNRFILKNINHTFKIGINRISGGNGTGKTTLLNIIGGHDGVFSGKVLNHNRNQLAYMPDVLNVFGNIVVENFIKSILAEIKVDFQKQIIFLDKIINIGPLLDNKINQLSFGQKRKILLFLTLIEDRPVWLLDEPFAGQDKKTFEDLSVFLGQESNKRTIIMADHSPESSFHHKTNLVLV